MTLQELRVPTWEESLVSLIKSGMKFLFQQLNNYRTLSDLFDKVNKATQL